MKTQIKLSLLLCASALLISGCSNTKETLGLTRTAPDEFAVISRAPLELPPEYTLRPPRPGAPRPQEVSTLDQSKTVVFGEGAVKPAAVAGSGESSLLMKAGAGNADPAIRLIVDAEHEAVKDEDKPVAEKLLGITLGGNKTKEEALDPVMEKQRLNKTPEPTPTE
jgi:hypothetical protein